MRVIIFILQNFETLKKVSLSRAKNENLNTLFFEDWILAIKYLLIIFEFYKNN